MDKILQDLIEKAKAQSGDNITPCSDNTWEECLTQHYGAWFLWFNDATGSTLVVTKKINDFK
jgi:hypothetical protein